MVFWNEAGLVGGETQIPPKFAGAGTASLRFAACSIVPVLQLSYCENFIILIYYTY